MAGRKHHHVPQFLQRRFGLQGAKSTKIVVYSASKPPFIANTSGFGAERDFYADGDDFFVDDLITSFEGDIQSFVFRLVEGDLAALADKATIASLVAHLEMRSMFLRNQLFEISGMMSDFFESVFGSRKTLIKLMENHLMENPDLLRSELTKHFGDDAPISALEEFILPQIQPLIVQQSAVAADGFAYMLCVASRMIAR